MKNHNFEAGDVVSVKHSYFGFNLTPDKHYNVLEVGFMSLKVINDNGQEAWIAAWAFSHVPRVTIVKKHLRRIVIGR